MTSVPWFLATWVVTLVTAYALISFQFLGWWLVAGTVVYIAWSWSLFGQYHYARPSNIMEKFFYEPPLFHVWIVWHSGYGLAGLPLSSRIFFLSALWIDKAIIGLLVYLVVTHW